MKKAIIGFTGFVGHNLAKQLVFDDLYNTSNIDKIKGKKYDLLIVAAPSAVKWKANREPEEDLKIVNKLINDLKGVKANYLVQISTVDVYRNPVNVDENTAIDLSGLHPYGKHHFMIEEFIRNNFEKHLVVRLPGLFGEGIKKNFIYDLINSNYLEGTHKDSVFQFYYLDNLWNDIEIAMKNNLSLINFATKPMAAWEVAKLAFNLDFDNVTDREPVNYDMKSIYSKFYGGKEGYLYSRDQIISRLKKFLGRINYGGKS